MVCEEKDPKTVKCAQIMTDKLVVGKTDMEVDSALQLMGDVKVRRLPVVEKGRLVGFVALGDMAVRDQFNKAAEEALSDISSSRSTLM